MAITFTAWTVSCNPLLIFPCKNLQRVLLFISLCKSYSCRMGKHHFRLLQIEPTDIRVTAKSISEIATERAVSTHFHCSWWETKTGNIDKQQRKFTQTKQYVSDFVDCKDAHIECRFRSRINLVGNLVKHIIVLEIW